MTFNPNKPQPNDLLSDSQVDLLDNNQANNTWSSVDHYALDDMGMNNGFHTHVTSPTPADGMHYSTLLKLNTILYGMQDSAGIGNIQYSRGPNDAVPSPVTTRQSSAASLTLVPATPQAILDFNALSPAILRCHGIVTASGIYNANAVVSSAIFCWPGAGVGVVNNITTTPASSPITFLFSGSVLQISNGVAPGSNVTLAAWTLRFERIWTQT